MANWTKALKRPAGDRPKLEHRRVRIKQDEKTKECFFTCYNSETKENEHIESPIQGYLIGTGLLLEAFDNQMQNTYRSNYIFNTKDNSVQVYTPTGSKEFDKPVTYAEAKAKMIALTGGAKVLYVMFVYDIESGETYGVHTNVSIGIDQHKQVKSHIGNGASIVLTPMEFGADTNISKKTRESLGKLALKNTPKYANIEIGAEITDEQPRESRLLDIIDLFVEWSGAAITAETETQSIDKSNGMADEIANKRGGEDLSALNPKEDDDLPF
jgi:hypothetical protein